ncbi:trypsin-like serine protease [Kitasatospora indigofera]|uniref:trypsin-like serine protease n=1 Tax=Kitasatospora indigofera TaxID=67307 RepID=UPI00365BDA16
MTTVVIATALISATFAAAPIADAAKPAKDSPVAAGSPTSSTLVTVDKATLRRQAQLDALADEITGTAGTESEHTGGYAGIVVHPETGELALYWKGAVPQKIRDVQSRATNTGLKVVVSAAAHSAQELETARDALEKHAKGKDAATEPIAAWNSVAVLPDGSGLSVTYNSPTSQSTQSVKAKAHTIAQQRITDASPVDFATRAQALVGVPVQAAPAPEMEDTYWRGDDSSPFWAGAQLITPSNAFCSSGFGGSHAGGNVVLTASHCGTSGTFITGSNSVEGWAGDYSLDYDTTFVNLNGSAGTQFYDGAWNDPNGYHKHIASWGLNRVGDYVCTSGAMSGVHCGLQVKYAGVDASIGGITRHNVVQALRTDSYAIASAQGDSGGPVVASPDSSYGNDMQARGLISGSYGEVVVCPTWGVGTAGQTTCFSGVSYIGMSAIVNTLGFTLYT